MHSVYICPFCCVGSVDSREVVPKSPYDPTWIEQLVQCPRCHGSFNTRLAMMAVQIDPWDAKNDGIDHSNKKNNNFK